LLKKKRAHLTIPFNISIIAVNQGEGKKGLKRETSGWRPREGWKGDGGGD